MKKKECKDCTSCINCQYICEGDFICDVGEPVLIMDEFTPTEFYFHCNGEDYESGDEYED